jgi:disulfide bond formation protein DsbB
MDKTILLNNLNQILAPLSLLGFVFIVCWFLLNFYYQKTEKDTPLFFKKVAEFALPLGMLTGLFAIFITLFYSDYLGALPCGLCWFQRVFTYPLFFMFALAWYKKDSGIFSYTTLLSIFGLIFALYHEYLQLGYSELIPCPTIASTVDCAKPTFIEYGFVTFPFMSIVLFMFFIALGMTVKIVNSKK